MKNIPRKFTEVLNKSLIKIESPHYSTGWFFHLDKPFFISTAHQFEKLDVNDEFNVSYLNKSFRARLIFPGNPSGGPFDDFSISEIIDPPKSYNILKTEVLTDNIDYKEFFSSGYIKSVSKLETPWPFSGDIHSFVENNKNEFIISLIDRNFTDKSGASGSPICIIKSNEIYVIGIQSNQIKYGKTQLLAFSLVNVADTEYLKEAIRLNQQEIRSYSRPYVKFNEPPITSYRLNLFLYPLNQNHENAPLFEEFEIQWTKFSQQIKNKLTKIVGNSHVLILPKKTKLNIKSQKDYSRISNRLLKKNLDLKNIRIVIDFNGVFDFELPISDFNTHLIGITLVQGEDRVYCTKYFDQIVCIGYSPEDEYDVTIEKILNVMEDIILDLNFFNQDSRLGKIFHNVELKKRFSQLKVEFAKELDLAVYDQQIKTQSLRYLALPSIIKKEIASNPQKEKYWAIWETFLSGALNRHIKQTFDNCIIIYINSGDDVINYLLSIPKLKGQLSREKIVKRFFELNTLPLVFAINGKGKPVKNSNTKKLEIANLLGHKNYRSNLWRFFEVQDLIKLMAYNQYLHIFIFLKSNDSWQQYTPH